VPSPFDEGGLSTKPKYCKVLLAWDEPVIAAMTYMQDHWAKCKKHHQNIG
jgi:hypothetical protein